MNYFSGFVCVMIRIGLYKILNKCGLALIPVIFSKFVFLDLIYLKLLLKSDENHVKTFQRCHCKFRAQMQYNLDIKAYFQFWGILTTLI